MSAGRRVGASRSRLRRAVIVMAATAAMAVAAAASAASSAQNDPADGCVRDLGTLDATATSASGSGIVAVDSDCTSSQRDPNDAVSVYYARRHTFTLDAAETVSVSVDDANSSRLRTYVVLMEGASSDGSGTVVARAGYGGTSYGSVYPARLDHLLLSAGTYTIEATTSSPGATGDYSVRVNWWPADGCVRDLGTLDATATSASGSGIVAVDSDCTSSQRDPNDAVSVYYARRHTFTLDAAATVSVSVGPNSSRSYLVLSDASGTEVGRDQGRDSSRYSSRYSSSARSRRGWIICCWLRGPTRLRPPPARRSRPAPTACGRTGGRLMAVCGIWGLSTRLRPSASGIIAVDASCVSSLRDTNPDSTNIYYARRHTFTLDAAATVSVSVGPNSSRSYLVLSDASGTEVGRDQGRDSSRYSSSEPARLDYLLLAAGTYTIEATTGSPQQTGSYSVRANWWPADGCVRDLGTLDATATSASGIIAVDASCVSSLRDTNPDSTNIYYARRHTFTLDAAATVSVGPNSSRSYLVLSDASGTEVGRDQGRDSSRYSSSEPARLDYLLLATYTIEATKSSPGATGGYTASVNWQAAIVCEESLEDLSGSLSGTLTSNCTSQQRDDDAVTTHYAKRYTFTVDSPVWLTAELKSDPAQTSALDTYLLLMTGHGPDGVVIERADGGGVGTDAEIADRYLAAGDYTIEATTGPAVGAGASGSSSARSARIATVGGFNLARTVQTPTEAAGNAVVGGLTQAVWMEQGQTLKLPFSFAYQDTAASSGALSCLVA